MLQEWVTQTPMVYIVLLALGGLSLVDRMALFMATLEPGESFFHFLAFFVLFIATGILGILSIAPIIFRFVFAPW